MTRDGWLRVLPSIRLHVTQFIGPPPDDAVLIPRSAANTPCRAGVRTPARLLFLRFRRVVDLPYSAGMKFFQVGLVFFVFSGVAWAANVEFTWTEVSREQMDSTYLSPRGRSLLEDPRFKWDHAQTEHFVIHFERKPFASKVGKLAEFFYDFIASDLKSAQDLAKGRSHLFIFRDEKDWGHFVQNYGVQMEWAFSLVEGMTMYLQQADDRGTSADVLGHEMTHMVFNRFYSGRLPLWLNEGTAEWYGEFAYEAFKGVRRNKRQVFRRLTREYPMASLIEASDYPADPEAVRAYYETSKYLVGFLQIRYPEETFEPFLHDIVRGMSTLDALRTHYGINSIEQLSAEFRTFSR